MRIVQMPKPHFPALSNGGVGQGVLPTPEGATGATSMTGRHGGLIRWGVCVGVRISSMAWPRPLVGLYPA